LRETYQSLVAQTVDNWEWVVVENNGGRLPEDIHADPRVRVFSSNAPPTIGALKSEACRHARAPWLVELDSDDLLTPRALEHIGQAFDQGAEFVFSNFAEFGEDFAPIPPFSAHYGWKSYEYEYRGRKLNAMRAPAATAQNLRLVEWAPNHVRAFTRDCYLRMGGHNIERVVVDDHDLCVRMYLAGVKMHHVNKCLYLYRMHPHNTVKTHWQLIRQGTWDIYNRHYWAMAQKWADDNALSKLDLGGAYHVPEGYTPVDIQIGTRGIQCDLNRTWKIPSDSVGVLRAHDVFEHLKNPIHTMNEAYRVLAPGGFLMVHVPSSNGKGAFCDPTHVSFWNDLSFEYYTNRLYSKFIPRYVGRFQKSRVQEWFPTPWHQENKVPYVEAHLIKLGKGYRPYGEVLI